MPGEDGDHRCGGAARHSRAQLRLDGGAPGVHDRRGDGRGGGGRDGDSSELAACSELLAQVAVRKGVRRGTMGGLLTAGELIADPDVERIDPDGVAVLAVADPGDVTAVAWVGDCRAWLGRHPAAALDHRSHRGRATAAERSTVGAPGLRSLGTAVIAENDHGEW